MHRLELRSFLFAVLLVLLALFFIGLSIDKRFFQSNHSIIYAEFIQSSDFGQLYDDVSHTFNYRVNGGTYNLGIPFSPVNETVYGTNRGVRIIPYIALLNIFQKIFLQWWDRLLFLFVLLIPFFGFLFSGYVYSAKNKFTLTVAALFYAFNPWIFNRLQTGFFQLHIAYALLPFLAIFLLQLNKKIYSGSEVIRIVISAIALTVSLLFQPHFVFGLIIGLFVYLLITLLSKTVEFNVRLIISRIFFLLLLTFILISFYLIPSYLYAPSTYTITDYFNIGALKFNGQGSTFIDVINLFARLPWESQTIKAYRNVPYSGFYIFYIWCALSTIFFSNSKRKKRIAALFFCEIILFTFLAKGVNPPFENISIFLYRHVPLLHIFRDPSRLMSFIVLFGSIACMHMPLGRVNKIVMIWAVVYLFICLPFLTTDINKRMGYQQIPFEVYRENRHLPNHEKLLFYPDNQPLSIFSWHVGPASSTYNSPVEALVPSKSDIIHYSGSNDSLIGQASLFAITEMEPQLLSRLRISRIMAQNDMTQANELNMKALPEGFNQTSMNKFVSIYESEKTIPIFSNHQPLFFIGSRKEYATFVKKIGDDVPIIFLNNSHNLSEFLKLGLEDQTIIYNNEDDIKTLYLSLLNRYSLNAHMQVWNYDKDFNYYLPYAAKDIASGYLLPSGKSIVSSKSDSVLKLLPKTEGSFILAISTIFDKDHSPFDVFVDGLLLTPSSTTPEGFIWRHNRINLNKTSVIEIKKLGANQVVIDDIILVPSLPGAAAKKAVDNLLGKSKLVLISDYQDAVSNIKMSYLERGFGKYEVFSNTNWLTFRFPYDKQWEIDNQKGVFISDEYAMTFFKDKSEKSKLIYKPEDLFQSLLKLSMWTFSVLVYVIFFYMLRKLFQYLRLGR
jgi:hypothetical protein